MKKIYSKPKFEQLTLPGIELEPEKEPNTEYEFAMLRFLPRFISAEFQGGYILKLRAIEASKAELKGGYPAQFVEIELHVPVMKQPIIYPAESLVQLEKFLEDYPGFYTRILGMITIYESFGFEMLEVLRSK